MPGNRAGPSGGSRASNQGARPSNQSARTSNQNARSTQQARQSHNARPSTQMATPSARVSRPSTKSSKNTTQTPKLSTSSYSTKLSSNLVLEPQGIDTMRELQRMLEGYNDLSKKAANAWRHAMNLVEATPSKNRRQAEATFLSHELPSWILADIPARAYQLVTLECVGHPAPWTGVNHPLSRVLLEVYGVHTSARDILGLLARVDESDDLAGKAPASETGQKKLEPQLARLNDLLGRVQSRQNAMEGLIEELEELLDVKNGL